MTMPDLLSIPAGQAKKGMLTPPLGYAVEVPYAVVRGRRAGPNLLVTAGVHGAEYASIEAALRIAGTSPDTLSGSLLVLPIVNPPSFFARSIYVNPVDGKNLNRVFPGRPDGSFAERLAHWLTESFIIHADAYVDLHGGDLIESLIPFSIYSAGHEASRELARVLGLPNLIASSGAGMSYAAGSAVGVPSVLAEAGGQGRWPEHSIEPLTKGLERVMIHLGMVRGEFAPASVQELDTFDWLRAERRGLWYPAVTAGDEVVAGQEVGVVKNLLGDVVQRAVCSVSGVVLFAVGSLSINEGDPLIGVGA